MKRIGRGGAFFLGVAAFYACVVGAWLWRDRATRVLSLAAERPSYLHYDIVELKLTTNDPVLDEQFRKSPPCAVVRRGGASVTTIGGLRELTLTRTAAGLWTARWPVPWNAPTGAYLPALLDHDELKDRLKISSFEIARRTPKPFPAGGLVVATLESVAPLATMRVKAPDGTEKDWRGLLDWAKEIGATAFLVLGGQSPGLQDGQIWVDTNLKMIPEVAKEAHSRGLLFGTYAMYSLTMSKTVKIPGYEYGLEIKDSEPVVTRAISLQDPKRAGDVANLLKPFADDPNVDFVGLDYIRNALGGYELVDDFVSEMPGVKVPPEWPNLSKTERMTWLARKKIMRKDMDFIDQWQWYRAHRVALIVKDIRRRLNPQKPLWAFTLTWDKGWHHGQDPVMMNDAGVDYDALMFYEADKPQYAAMVKAWHEYVRQGDVQLVPGDIFDWGLHQKDPAGPAEFTRRMRLAVRDVYADGPAKGVFYHDTARLLWGRLGPWGTKGWADAAKTISSEVKIPVVSEKKP